VRKWRICSRHSVLKCCYSCGREHLCPAASAPLLLFTPVQLAPQSQGIWVHLSETFSKQKRGQSSGLCPCSTPFYARMISRHDAQLYVQCPVKPLQSTRARIANRMKCRMQSKRKEPKAPRPTLRGTKSSRNQHTNSTNTTPCSYTV
jgi:hypothetical protein